jgi:hypothetical protein
MEGSALHPQLTTVRVFPRQVGARLAEVLIEGIERPDRPPRQWVIPTELIKRESCGPPLLKDPEKEVSAEENGALIHSNHGAPNPE